MTRLASSSGIRRRNELWAGNRRYALFLEHLAAATRPRTGGPGEMNC